MKDLFYTAYNAQVEYVSDRIYNEINKTHYLNTANYILKKTINSDNFNELYDELYKLAFKIPKYKYSFIDKFLGKPKEYNELAYTHAIRLFYCLEERFINGRR